jgi:diguanylate cyclase (GGDEF)-like protein
MRASLLIRPISIGLLLLHLLLRITFSDPKVFIDLILFNLIGILAAVIALTAPVVTDRKAAVAIGYAGLIWSFGSIFSTWNSFFEIQLPSALSDICYSLFYPLIFFGVVRAFTLKVKTGALELLDTVIIAVGFTSVLTAFFLKPAMLTFEGSAFTVFLSILYPVGDIVILAMALVYLILNPISKRSLVLCFGLFSFSISDLLFLWLSINNKYHFGSLTDDGWILGLLLISLSLSYPGGVSKKSEKISSYAATIALIASGTLLGIAAIKPGYFPTFILIPGFVTIALAFVRMSFALQEANSAGTERLLARTDELTGLANRRNFLSQLANMKSGFIFLLDLDGFKGINDTLGHESGDQLLKQVASRFMRAIPNDSHLARLGGDEFGIIASISKEEAVELGQAIKATLSYPISLAAEQVKVGVSVGITEFNPELTSSELLHQADQMMYEAKRGKTGVRIWSE